MSSCSNPPLDEPCDGHGAAAALSPGLRHDRSLTESGFYYDFDNPEPFTKADLKAIKQYIKIITKSFRSSVSK